MKKRLKDSKATYRLLRKLPKVYLIGCWARYGVREHYFSGLFKKHKDGSLEPMVYHFDDHNGTFDEWILMPITETTTGSVLDWTFNCKVAQRIAEKFNIIEEA